MSFKQEWNNISQEKNLSTIGIVLWLLSIPLQFFFHKIGLSDVSVKEFIHTAIAMIVFMCLWRLNIVFRSKDLENAEIRYKLNELKKQEILREELLNAQIERENKLKKRYG